MLKYQNVHKRFDTPLDFKVIKWYNRIVQGYVIIYNIDIERRDVYGNHKKKRKLVPDTHKRWI